MSGAKTLVVNPSHWHVPLYIEQITAKHQVVGVSDADPARAPQLARQWDAPVYASWEEMLAAHRDAELAYVFAPHDTMHEVCLELIARGIPLVVEKPAGISLQQVSELRRAAEDAGVPVTVPLVQRDGPVDRWLAQAGSSVYESAQFIAGPPDRYLTNGSPWMVELERAGGGCMINLAPHFVDLFLRSAGTNDARVTSALSSRLHGREIEDFASITVRTADARIATIEVGYAFPNSPLKRHCAYLRIGEAGTATIWSNGVASFTAVDGTVRSANLDVDSDPLYATFVNTVAERLDQGFAGLPTLSDLEDTMRVIWQAYEFDRNGRRDVHTQHR